MLFRSRATEWQAVTLEPGKLFLVGDPKQSIYGFRRADLDLYGRVVEIVERQGGLLQLRVNFRTVPEVIAARHCGLRVLGLSLVTNMAAGLAPGAQLNHQEVLETGKRRERAFARLIRAIVRAL